MTTYQVGSTIYGAVEVYDVDDNLADVGAMSASFTLPDGTTGDGAVTRTELGRYQASITSTQVGRHQVVFTATGANSGDFPRTQLVDVWPTDPRFIISLDDLRAELNVPAGVTVNDDELQLYIAATTPVVEEIVGRVLQETLSETFDGGKAAVLLSERAASVTTVTVNGVVTTNYVANLASGIVYAGTTSAPTTFTPGRQNVVITYLVGATTIPPNVVLAARIIAAHQYQVGQQGRTGRGRPIDETRIIGSGYAVPTRALQLLVPSMAGRMPGFA